MGEIIITILALWFFIKILKAIFSGWSKSDYHRDSQLRMTVIWAAYNKINYIIFTSSLLLRFTLSRADCKRVYSVSTTVNKMFWQPGGNEVFDQFANLFVLCDFWKSLGSVLQCSIAVSDKCLPKQEKQLTGWAMLIRGHIRAKTKATEAALFIEWAGTISCLFFNESKYIRDE